MPVSFHTVSQHMTFVDQTPLHHVQNANFLLPGQTYDVFITLANSDAVEALGVQVHVNHSAFGIGLPGGDSYIAQPSPVNVPPALDGDPGLATIQFQFTAPAAGHGCLYATIKPNGPGLSQNITVYSVVPGAKTLLSFLVYGDLNTAEKMTLNLTERLDNGSLVPAANSWQPLLVPPTDLTGSATAVSMPAPLTVNLGKGSVYSIGLQVAVPKTATQAHIFHITGTIKTPGDAGEVDIRVEPTATNATPPHPYVSGGYHSPDIILIDPATHLAVPLFGDPGDPNTILRPNTNYGFQVVVHNDSPTPAVNTVVRFWMWDSLSKIGTPVDVQSATIPANGQVVVVSEHPFLSAPEGRHRCAAVSIYNSQSVCQNDSTVFYDANQNAFHHLPDAGTDGNKSCAAWRNTDSKFIYIGKPWQINLDMGFVLPGPGPVEQAVRVDVTTQHVPADHAAQPAVIQAAQTLRELGGHALVPTFLLTAVRPTLPLIDLGVKIQAAGLKTAPIAPPANANPKAVQPVSLSVTLPSGRPAPIAINGITPADAKAGDMYLVEVAATYPQDRNGTNNVVRFTHALVVHS